MHATDGTAPRIKSADRVLDVFEILSNEPQGVSFPELLRRMGVPKSSLHGLLGILVERQYLDFDPVTRHYRFGVQLFEHGQSFLKHHADVREAKIAMERVVAEVNETVQLSLLRGSEGVNLATVDCTHPLRMHLEVGRHFTGHATSLGKVLLAHLPEDEARSRIGSGPLERFTEHTMLDAETLFDELRKIADRGFSLDTEECIPGIFCIGVPILDNTGAALIGMSVTIPTSRLTSDLLSRALASLATGSIAVSQRMGARHPHPPLALIADRGRAQTALAGTKAAEWL